MGTLHLTIVDGPDAGRIERADGETVVGRGEGVELTLSDPSVSRRHAVLRPVGSTAVVEDLGSSNGTYVNEELIDEPRRVGDGDAIRVGTSVLELRVGPTETEEVGGEATEIIGAHDQADRAAPAKRADEPT